MSDAILVAIITGGLSLLGIIYSSGKSASKVDAKLDKQQAVIETKLNSFVAINFFSSDLGNDTWSSFNYCTWNVFSIFIEDAGHTDFFSN